MTSQTKLLWVDYLAALRSFQRGEHFGSAVVRQKCIKDIFEMRAELEALGERVMSEKELSEQVGEF